MGGDLEVLLRVSAAVVLAGAIGWERESLGKPAGLRTHILVGIGAALAVAVGDSLIESLRSELGPDPGEILRVDPLRLVEAVLTGIGFLGAGTIILSRDKDQVSGLTTAASIWATASVGLAAGAGEYLLAAGATALICIILRGLGHLEHRRKILADKSE